MHSYSQGLTCPCYVLFSEIVDLQALKFTHNRGLKGLNKNVVFTSDLSCCTVKTKKPVKWSRVGLSGPLAARDFIAMFEKECRMISVEYCAAVLNVDKLLNMFNSLCTSVLDTIAPLRSNQCKDKYEAWLNSDTCCLRQVYRRAERRWKKDMKLCEFLTVYQKAGTAARSVFLSEQITKNSSSSRALFNILKSVTNPTNNINLPESVLCSTHLNDRSTCVVQSTQTVSVISFFIAFQLFLLDLFLLFMGFL